MLIVRVELESAITGEVTELARMYIGNIGGTPTSGDYVAHALRGRSKEEFDESIPQRTGHVRNYPRLALHVWHLVARALIALGYAGKEERAQASDMLPPVT